MRFTLKRTLIYLLLALLLGGGYLVYRLSKQLYPSPRIEDSPTTFIGFNHVGINVLDLDKMLDFYLKATDYTLLNRYTVSQHKGADVLFGQKGMQYEKAILKGPNMLLELTEFANQTDSVILNMSPKGPGMTHTCYQSSSEDSGYDKFVKAGVNMLSRGNEPVDLGGYGVTYAYAYDPEGNMVELEQLEERLITLQIGSEWAKQHPLWMTQVALLSPDLPRLIAYYKKLLAIEPFRVGSYKDNPKFDDVVDLDNMAFDAAWFGMDTQGKKLELMQYMNPPTPTLGAKKKLTDLGYTYSFEVLDIHQEYQRLSDLGIDFVSKPQKIDEFWEVFAYDIDGNIFSLRQPIDKNSQYSLKNF